jgi:hypothetical protein
MSRTLRLRPARVVRALVAASCLFSFLEACGGRSDTEDYLFGEDGNIVRGGTSTGVGGASASGKGNVGSGGKSGTTGGATGAGGKVGVGGKQGMGSFGGINEGGEPSIGGTGTGGAGVAGSGGIVNDGGASPVGTPITCGGQVCDSSTQFCCAGFGGFACVANGKACNGATLGCTTNADCADVGGVCCISITGDSDAASSCKNRCDNAGTGRDRQLCRTAGDCLEPFRFCTPTVFGVNICTRRP